VLCQENGRGLIEGTISEFYPTKWEKPQNYVVRIVGVPNTMKAITGGLLSSDLYFRKAVASSEYNT
jgi:hypothetical protein